MQAFSRCSEQGLLFIAVRRLRLAETSLVEHRLWGVRAQQLRLLGSSTGSVVAHARSCSVACGVVLDQGSNLCLLHWQVDS